MAYTRQKRRASPVPGADPGILSVYVPISTGEINITVPVPWDGCKLVHSAAIWLGCGSAAAPATLAGGDHEIDLELDAAGGTELMSISIVSATTVGTVTEGTFSNEASCGGLDSANNIIIESDGPAGLTSYGGINVLLYFEPDSY